jgi:hypothetical protein
MTVSWVTVMAMHQQQRCIGVVEVPSEASASGVPPKDILSVPSRFGTMKRNEYTENSEIY